MDLGVSGLASGFDWRSLVDQLSQVERLPQERLRSEQSAMRQRQQALASLGAELINLQTRVDALKEASLFGSRSATSSDATVATVEASSGALQGNYEVNVLQMAKAAVWRGAGGLSASLSDTDISDTLPNPDTSPTVGSAPFSQKLQAGEFTVNGQRVSIESTDTLRQVFEKISLATGGEVTASYSTATDKITLSSAGEIVLGSATDSSNFLQAARLANNGTGQVVSASQVAGLNLSDKLNVARLSTPINDGGGGAGEFKINGVSIAFNAATDSVADVLNRINNSKAGVQASYDSANDQFTLVNKVTGDMGVALEDMTGNFLQATGLAGGSLQRGQDLFYTINGGSQLSSSTNSITESSSGLTGVTLTALKQGATTVAISVDKAKIKQAITDFIDAYNKAQGLIDTQTSSSTDAKGKVTSGILAGDRDVTEAAMRLRGLSSGSLALPGISIDRLDDLGITTSGYSNSLTLKDESALDQAIEEKANDLQTFFADANGWAATLSAYLKKTAGEEGTLVKRQDSIIEQSAKIDSQIASMERIVLSNRQRLIDSFVNMESARAKLDQQMVFLQQQLGSAS